MRHKFRIRVGEREHEVSVEPASDPASHHVIVDGETREVILAPDDVALVRDPGTGHQRAVTLDHDELPRAATVAGQAVAVHLRSAEDAALEAALAQGRPEAGGRLAAPMPGRVVKVLVALGDEVERGAPVLIIEAMKMENELHAPAGGRVIALTVGPGDTVEAGALLCEIAPAHAASSD